MSKDFSEFETKKLVNFEVGNGDLLSFCDCLSLIRNEIGLVAWDSEDFLALFGEGTTVFYTAKAKNLKTAIENLRLQIQNTPSAEYVFLILVASGERIQQEPIEEYISSASQWVPSREFWFQIYPLETISTASNETISYTAEDAVGSSDSTTVYLLINRRNL